MQVILQIVLIEFTYLPKALSWHRLKLYVMLNRYYEEQLSLGRTQNNFDLRSNKTQVRLKRY